MRRVNLWGHQRDTWKIRQTVLREAIRTARSSRRAINLTAPRTAWLIAAKNADSGLYIGERIWVKAPQLIPLS
jgi:hypothetical protein